ncbi:hypothetical protein D9M70_638770 [compost metagenome]
MLGIKLQGETSHVALGVGSAKLTGNGRKAREHLGFLSNLGENRSLAVPGDVVGDGQCAVGAPALGVNDTLRNALTVLVSQLLDQVVVLQ